MSGSRQDPLKVLSIVAAGRSGTTVLASIFGEIDGFGSPGELRFLWDRGVQEDRPCGCGEPPSRCQVWTPVIARTLARLAELSPGTAVEQIVAAQNAVTRNGGLTRTLRSLTGTDPDSPELQVVRTATGLLCTSFAEVTGSRVVVDTSKRPLDAAVLAGLPEVDHYVVHVVRDPHAVVHSWRRRKTFQAAGGTRSIGTRGLASTVLRWTSNCRGAEALRRHVPPHRWLHIRYEDFAARPRDTVEDVLAFLGESAATPFTDERTVLLGGNHIVAGNPSRFTTGAVRIEVDDEWRSTMRLRDKAAIDALTLPLRRRYGYASAGRAPSGSTLPR